MLFSVASLFGQQSSSLANNKTYANSQADTATLPSNVGSFTDFTLTYTVRDTALADIYVDTKPKGQATASWTNQYADSVKYQNTGANFVQEIILRSTTLNRAPGINIDVRVRTVWRGSGNGVTTPQYDNVLKYFK